MGPCIAPFVIYYTFIFCGKVLVLIVSMSTYIMGRLGKLHGKAQPHSEEVEWWRTFMVECVWMFDTL